MTTGRFGRTIAKSHNETAMRIRILGSAAGGGLPQWNCRCPNCQAVRVGSPNVQPRTQSSVAISADGHMWYLLNVSADIRQQLALCPDLAPPAEALRGTRIAGCVLTDAELDHTSGLLQLREGCSFGIFSTPFVHRCLNQFLPIESILAGFADRPWIELTRGRKFELPAVATDSSRLTIMAFDTGGGAPRYVPEQTAEEGGCVVGLRIEDSITGGVLVYAPCVQSLTVPLFEATENADCILMDGTFWTDDEPIDMGIGCRTSQQMGHVPVSGSGGSLNWLANSSARHRIYVHMNNTNPMLNDAGPQRQEVIKRGVQVGMDGDVFDL